MEARELLHEKLRFNFSLVSNARKLITFGLSDADCFNFKDALSSKPRHHRLIQNRHRQ